MDDFARALVSFFAVIGPVSNALVFYLLTRSFDAGARLRTAATAVGVAFALMAVFALAGNEVLDFLGISGPSFRIAAGLLLALPAYRLVAEGQPMHVAETERVDATQLALVPLATPLMAGPGALATAVSLTDTMGLATTLSSMAAVLALSFALFSAAERVLTLIGEAPVRLASRLVGILLVAIAVDFVVEGMGEVFPGLVSA